MIPIAQPLFAGNEKTYVNQCLDEGWISSKGTFITRFEEAFATYHAIPYATTTANGTVALHLALHALGIKEGDEVLVPDLTYVATANAVKYCGATPVFVDVDETWTFAIDELEKKITEKTKAILAVHLYGNPARMKEICALAKEKKLFVIEDCAEALGAEIEGRKVGTWGDVGCFSFFGNKIITSGEGGMCITKDKVLHERMSFLKSQAMDVPYFHPETGFNYRMTNVQAAIGLAQLEQLPSFLAKREKIAKLYEKYLEGKELKKHPKISHGNQVCWLYCILHKNASSVMKKLKEEGIETRPFFTPLDELPFFEEGNFPRSKQYAKEGINLPTHCHLTEEDIKKICSFL